MARKRSRWDVTRARKLRVLASMPEIVRKRMRPTLERNARRIVTLQKIAAPGPGSNPYSTGELRASITYSFGNRPDFTRRKGARTGPDRVSGDKDLSVWIYAADFKGRWVEFGTAPRANHPGTSPMPFFYPTIRLLRRDVTRSIQRVFGRAVKAAGLPGYKPRGRNLRPIPFVGDIG